MPFDPRLCARRRHVRAQLAFGWLLTGSAVLALTPLQAWSPLLGWGPGLALVMSPLLVLLTLEPRLHLHALAMYRRRRCW